MKNTLRRYRTDRNYDFDPNGEKVIPETYYIPNADGSVKYYITKGGHGWNLYEGDMDKYITTYETLKEIRNDSALFETGAEEIDLCDIMCR